MRDHDHQHETEERLVELLGRAGERIPVAAAPVSAIRARARAGRGGGVSRGRRPWAPALAVAASIALIIGGLAMLTDLASPRGPVTTVQRIAATTLAQEPPPPGTLWRGVAPVAVPVPVGWARARGEDAGCLGGELSDTFSLEPRYRETLGNCEGVDYRGPGVETVYVGPATPAQFSGRERREVVLGEDVVAERSAVTCVAWSYRGRDDLDLCRGSISLQELGLIVNVTSTTSRSEVGRLLDEVRIFGDAATVPLVSVAPDGPRETVASYGARLRAAGLRPETRRVASPEPPGQVLRVEPAAGAVVAAGSDVVLDVSAGPSVMADELAVPPGMELLGIGSVAVPVPAGWLRRSRAEAECGSDTAYVLSSSEAGLPADDRGCGAPTAGVDRVTVAPARRDAPTGAARACFGSDPVQCGGQRLFDRLGLVVTVNSSTDQQTVDRILERVRVLTDHVGVPSPLGLDAREYASQLRTYGLAPELRPVPTDDVAPGSIVSLPESGRLPEAVTPGTVLPRGTKVQVPYAAG